MTAREPADTSSPLALSVRSITDCPANTDFEFFPGFYKHVVDTMRRTPSFDGRKAADHLVPTTRVGFTQYGKPDFLAPTVFPLTPGDAGAILRDILLMFEPITGLTPDDLAFFGARIWQILTSCHERRLAEYERTSWWDFVGAESRSAAYQKFLAIGITRSLVAAKARKASTRTIGDIFVQLILSIMNPTAAASDRVLDGPTNLVWIDPWLAYLESRGVRYVRGAQIEEILCPEWTHRRRRRQPAGETNCRDRRLLYSGAAGRENCAFDERRHARGRSKACELARACRQC